MARLRASRAGLTAAPCRFCCSCSGPTTVRANEPVQPLVERMRAADVDGILVTAPEGRLIGLMDRHHVEEVLDA